MKEKIVLSNSEEKMYRRIIIKNGAALVGAGFLGSYTKTFSEEKDEITSNIFNIKNFGATGQRNEKSTLSIQAAIDACTVAGGGMVYVPPGDYTTGTLKLKDNVTLKIESGATLYLSQDPKDFTQGSRTMIFAENSSNISVIGKGKLDGLAEYEFREMTGVDPEISLEIDIARKAGIDMRRYYRSSMQTYMFILNNCTNVLLQDISVLHSPLWNIRFNDCNRVFVRGIYIFSDLEKGVNADGIDICSSSNVTISDSVIISGDDSIVLKTPLQRGQEKANPTENIVVTNCVLTSSSTALMIGTETYGDIRHIIFSNCTIRNSNKGFGINVQDGCTVSNIIFSNLTIETNRRHWNWWGSAEMCKFVLRKRSNSSRMGVIKDIVIENIIATVRGTSSLKGNADQPLENFRMNNVQIFMNPEDAKDKRTSDALVIEDVKELRIRDLSIKWAENQPEPKWQSAAVFKNVSDLELRSFSGRQGLKESLFPAIVLENVSESLIAESRATQDCGTFIALKGQKSHDIILRENNTIKATREISYESENLKKAIKTEKSK